eukprot:11470-Amphidinium_carterae.1
MSIHDNLTCCKGQQNSKRDTAATPAKVHMQRHCAVHEGKRSLRLLMQMCWKSACIEPCSEQVHTGRVETCGTIPITDTPAMTTFKDKTTKFPTHNQCIKPTPNLQARPLTTQTKNPKTRSYLRSILTMCYITQIPNVHFDIPPSSSRLAQASPLCDAGTFETKMSLFL